MDHAQITIRHLAREDEAAWRKLWTDYLTFYKSTVPDAVYDATFARQLGDAPEDFNAFVAEQDGQLVGFVHYLFHRHCWRVENVCYLQDLYATPEVRGQGVGRKLIEAVYAAADAADASSVYWLTQDDNMTAQQLYDRIAKKTNFSKYQRPA